MTVKANFVRATRLSVVQLATAIFVTSFLYSSQVLAADGHYRASDENLLKELARWITSNSGDKGKEDFESISEVYKKIRQLQKSTTSTPSQNAKINLNCLNTKSTGVPEEKAKSFELDLDAKEVSIWTNERETPTWKFDRVYDDDETWITDLDGGDIRKILVHSNRATVPNILEIYLKPDPISVRWVYIMGQQTEELAFSCVRTKG